MSVMILSRLEAVWKTPSAMTAELSERRIARKGERSPKAPIGRVVTVLAPPRSSRMWTTSSALGSLGSPCADKIALVSVRGDGQPAPRSAQRKGVVSGVTVKLLFSSIVTYKVVSEAEVTASGPKQLTKNDVSSSAIGAPEAPLCTDP